MPWFDLNYTSLQAMDLAADGFVLFGTEFPTTKLGLHYAGYYFVLVHYLWRGEAPEIPLPEHLEEVLAAEKALPPGDGSAV